MSETQLVTRIKNFLKTVPGTLVIKHHGGPFSEPGVSDLLVCHNGKFIAMEVKLPGKEKKLTDLQRNFLDRVRKAGGLAYAITSVFDAKEIIDKESL